MARSLTIKTEEQASTSALLTGFLVLIAAFLAIGAIASASEPPVEAQGATAANATP
jgi:hypothetical protein